MIGRWTCPEERVHRLLGAAISVLAAIAIYRIISG